MTGIRALYCVCWLMAGALLLLGSGGCDRKSAEPELNTLGDRVGYGIGLRLGQDFRGRQLDIDPAIVLRGLQDGLTDSKPLLSDQEIQEALNQLQQELSERQRQTRVDEAERNLQEGREFLVRKGKEAGVEKLPSGLHYQVLRQGEGEGPGPSDRVKVHYRGLFTDGREFDSSYARNQPVTFPVSGVIPGWQEALLNMKQGGHWRIFLPPELAYGEQGAGSTIGPNEVLVYEIELLEIER
ncbi:MAG: FKBP-type peptidyl-prolyl cis-trans isomerase [Syntrophotaleaceae bacterium]